nr:unnamed protein product [Digitaria exilis]
MAEAAVVAVVAKNAAIFMGKTAAGAAISYFVNKALGRLSAEDEDIHKKLMDKLPIIEAVFDAGNQPQVWENPALAAPMWQFRDALQEAEDALDELEYMDLEKEVKDRRAQEAKGWKVRLSARLPSAVDFDGLSVLLPLVVRQSV